MRAVHEQDTGIRMQLQGADHNAAQAYLRQELVVSGQAEVVLRIARLSEEGNLQGATQQHVRWLPSGSSSGQDPGTLGGRSRNERAGTKLQDLYPCRTHRPSDKKPGQGVAGQDADIRIHRR